MKIKYKDTVEVDQELDINLPYYFKNVLKNSAGISDTYGKIDVNRNLILIIHDNVDIQGEKWSISKRDHIPHYYCKMIKESESIDILEFEEIKKKAIEFIENI